MHRRWDNATVVIAAAPPATCLRIRARRWITAVEEQMRYRDIGTCVHTDNEIARKSSFHLRLRLTWKSCRDEPEPNRRTSRANIAVSDVSFSRIHRSFFFFCFFGFNERITTFSSLSRADSSRWRARIQNSRYGVIACARELLYRVPPRRRGQGRGGLVCHKSRVSRFRRRMDVNSILSRDLYRVFLFFFFVSALYRSVVVYPRCFSFPFSLLRWDMYDETTSDGRDIDSAEIGFICSNVLLNFVISIDT